MGRLFGTDGVRGVANAGLTCETALAIGRATAAVLADGRRRRPVVAVGCDTRTSSDMLVSAVTCGLCSIGADVISLGVVPTPAVAHLVIRYKADAGIMITASHNSGEYNGIKIFGGDGYKLPDMLEDRIEEITEGGGAFEFPTGEGVGRVSIAENARRDYINHVKSSVPYSLDGLEIAVDCANGSASLTAEKLFTGLGAKVHMLADKPDGGNINRDCGSTHIGKLAAYVRENGLCAGVAFDGDADRCLAVDEKGELVDGDAIMAICALDLAQRGRLAANAVVGTVLTNFGFYRFCEDNGLRFVATKVGDRFVLEEMLLEDFSFGGEQSGHVIFRDFETTGDGQLTAAQLLSLLRRKAQPLSQLAAVMKHYPQTSINITTTPEGKLLFYTDTEIRQAIEAAKEKLGAGGRVVVRPSGTEPLIRVMAEGEDTALIQTEAERVAAVIRKRLTNN